MVAHFLLEVGGEPAGILVDDGAGLTLLASDPLSPLHERRFATVTAAEEAVRADRVPSGRPRTN